MSGDIFYRNGVFYSQTVTLTFYPCLVNQDTTVGSETCTNNCEVQNCELEIQTHRRMQDKHGHQAWQPSVRS